MPDETTVEVESEEPLLEAALRQGIAHANSCEGDGVCSTCRIMVFEGLEHCAPRTRKEALLADRLGFAPEVRLACQTTVAGDVTVRRLVLDARDEAQVDQRTKRIAATPIGDQRFVAILFADMRRFTSMTESLLPYDVIHLLNRYFREMDQVIQGHGGYIASFVGDGLMAIFGAEDTTTPSETALSAVQAGIEMLDKVNDLGPYVEWLHGRELDVSIGIHCGTAVVGLVGGLSSSSVTAVGDVVNTASRIEAANRVLDTSFIISEDVYLAVSDHIDARPLRPIGLPGKTGQFVLYQVLHAKTIK